VFQILNLVIWRINILVASMPLKRPCAELFAPTNEFLSGELRNDDKRDDDENAGGEFGGLHPTLSSDT